jgi:hypothetical protein
MRTADRYRLCVAPAILLACLLAAAGAVAQVDTVVPDPVLSPGAIASDPALSPEQMNPPPVQSVDAVRPDAALSPEETTEDPALSPD